GPRPRSEAQRAARGPRGDVCRAELCAAAPEEAGGGRRSAASLAVAEAVLPAAPSLPRDQRTVPARQVVGHGSDSRRVPRLYLPTGRGGLRPLRAAASRVGGQGHAARRSPRGAGGGGARGALPALVPPPARAPG